MPDFGTPVANSVDFGPSKGLKTLSDLMGLQQQKQAIQSKDIGIQQQQTELSGAQADTQAKQQAMVERQKVTQMLQTGMDDSGNSIRDANGEPDPSKVLPALGRIAPYTGQQYAQNILKTHTDKVTLRSAGQNLTAAERQKLAGPIQAIAVDPSDTSVGAAKTAINDWATQHPEMRATADSALNLMQHIEGTKDPKQRQHFANSLSALLQSGQQVQTQPAAGTQNLGNVVQQGTVAPPVAGGGFTSSTQSAMGVPPAAFVQTGINPLTGQPYSINMAPSVKVKLPNGETFEGTTQDAQAKMKELADAGDFAGVAEIQRVYQHAAKDNKAQESPWPRLPQFPSPQQTASATAAGTETEAIRASDSHPVTGYEPTRQVYSNLLNLVSKSPAIGPKSQSWNQLTGALTPFGASPNSTMQEVDSYLDRLALQNAGAAGLSTDAARHMSAVASGTTEMNPEALKEKLRFGAATLEAAHAYRQGIDKAVGTANENPIAKRAFDSLWTQNADIMAFRLLAAKRNGDKQGYDKTLEQIQSLPPTQRATIQQHMRNLNLLANGHMPPQ